LPSFILYLCSCTLQITAPTQRPLAAIIFEIAQKLDVHASSLSLIMSDGSPLAGESVGDACHSSPVNITCVHSEPSPASSFVMAAPVPLVVVVGGGPVGLWFAIQLKALLPPSAVVRVHEKRETYERTHALRISDYAFKQMIDYDTSDGTDPAAFQRNAVAHALRQLRSKWQPRTRTATVEQDLKTLAQTCGVQLRYGAAVQTLQQLIADERPCAIICANGAGSTFRKELAELAREPEEFRHAKKLGHLLQCKYDVKGNYHTQKGNWAAFCRNFHAHSTFFNVLAGRYVPDQDITPITAFALLDDETASSMGDAFSGRPITSLDDLEEKMKDSGLRNDIASVLIEPRSHTDPRPAILMNTLKISVLPAAYTVASCPAGMAHAVPTFLIGDAAMGLALEKGLNFGWHIASRLAHVIAYSKEEHTAMAAHLAQFHVISEAAVQEMMQQYSSYKSSVHTAGSASRLLPLVLYPLILIPRLSYLLAAGVTRKIFQTIGGKR
jgi:2-polyprenyl-6-methoxyphenol hydroxylase-like FAD-dependent oxidoreductase